MTEEPAGPTPEDAVAFVKRVDAELRALWIEDSKRGWDRQTNITPETEKASAEASERVMAYLGTAIPEAAKFDAVKVDPDTRRQLELLKHATSLPAPRDAAKRAELAEIATELDGMYGKGKSCITKKAGKETCRDLDALSGILSSQRDWDKQLEAWQGWHSISVPMRSKYQRFVELGNEGAREIGYQDVGDLWRSGYDMSPAELEGEVERLWTQVSPLYKQLQCHVRYELAEKYGEKMPKDGTIPAHVTGNMWAQDWSALYPMLEPYKGQPSIDVTKALKKKKYTPKKMVEGAENFFVSLGLDKLPPSFWERSMFDKPKDREVVCHASAWDVTFSDDLRIKMCIKVDEEDFITIHHELGHDYYFHYYYTLPVLYQQGAHDGFHEGIGDTLALSVTPAYLKRIGLLDVVAENDKAVVNQQMNVALQKIAFLPFGLVVDKWRWEVFSGRIKPEDYNAGWWRLRQKYQGVSSPTPRGEEFFDAGAKYHVPGNTPYLRYFLAHILQFQFHKALCQAAGHTGPLHTCSIYDSKEAGAKLQAMLAMGASKPWPDALEAIAGTRKMDAGPLLEYFSPLMTYLEEQNKGRDCGWTE